MVLVLTIRAAGEEVRVDDVDGDVSEEAEADDIASRARGSDVVGDDDDDASILSGVTINI